MQRRPELIPLAVLTGLLAVVGVLIGVAPFLDFSAPSIQNVHRFEVLDTQFAFDVNAAETLLQGLEEPARQAYRSFELLDFLFMGLYTVVLAMAIRALTEPPNVLQKVRKLALLPVITGASDAVEDIAILIALGSPDPSRAALLVAHCAGIFKYVFLAIAVGALVVLAGIRLWRSEPVKYQEGESVEQTYFSLRLTLTLIVVMLLVALAIQGVREWCAMHSISAFYYSPLQPMFVGVLVAIGICLIVYQGTTYLENLLLDIAGFMAFIVAFVPTADPKSVCTGKGYVGLGVEQSFLVWRNVLPLLLVAFMATFIAFGVRLKKDKSAPHPRLEVRRIGAGLGAQLVVLAALLFLNGQFVQRAHGIAATTLFVCIIAVVVINHIGRKDDSSVTERKNVYGWVAAVMAGTLIVCVAAHLIFKLPHLILIIETLLITEFAVYWAIQTKDLRGRTVRSENSGEED
ncbi:hypothetical protein SK803_16995 [Lentzea sp. BCCO 10_0856]|uniref:Uncharacterized protein n=1 Tax=Lentzea miocenica TaxID=3095431 RepID=A0ABU4T185_9PSEU|nr:hypothetical protein [Lentzea sp. BCCO 10_0856]MDX8031924.1 hypothetical protein [Lentzea sp. BCCO 10_0856]